MQPGLLDEELRRRTAFGFAEVVAIVAKPVENVSLSRIRRAPWPPRRRSTARGERSWLAIAPGDVVLNGCDAHGRRLSRGEFGEPLGGLVEHLGALAEREPNEVPALVPFA